MSGIEYLELPGSWGTLRGMIHHGSAGTLVIIVHGYFSSNKIGPYRLYFELAETLQNRGATVVRMDLSGMGESDGRIEEVRYEHHLSDFELLMATLRSEFSPDGLHVVAHCAGCNIALSTESAEKLRSLTLIAPFVPSEHGFEGRMFTKAEWRELLATGSTLRKGWYCHKSFFDSAAVLSRPLNAALQKTTHVIFAGKDEITPLLEAQSWARLQNIRHSQVLSADHNFTSRDSRDELFEIVSRAVLDSSGA